MAGAITSTGRVNYCTPEKYITKVREFFMLLNGRGITLDPSSNPESTVDAQKNIMLEDVAEANLNYALRRMSRELEWNLFQGTTSPQCPHSSFLTGDGLNTNWQGENVYNNPPFGYDKVTKIGIKTWINKALAEAAVGTPGTEIILCIPDTPETKPWKNGILLKAQGRCQLGKRVTFVGMKAVIPKPISLVYFGSNPDLFKQVFKTIGRVENPSQVYGDQAEITL